METEKTNSRVSRQPNDCDKLVGARVRQKRIECGLTIQTIANELGISHQQVQKYETGKNRISAGLLPAFADAFGVDINQFFADAQSSESEKKPPADKLRAECEAALRRLKSEETLSATLKVIKAMAD